MSRQRIPRNATRAQHSQMSEQNWQSARARVELRITMFIQQVLSVKQIAVADRVRIAGQFLRDKVVANLSRPVRKFLGPVSRRIQVDPESRSKPGEFPRADTTALMKSIFHDHDKATATSKVGFDKDYGLVLELRMNRSFLRRTLNEERANILTIISGGGGPSSGNVLGVGGF